jgi:hypothetical protein
MFDGGMREVSGTLVRVEGKWKISEFRLSQEILPAAATAPSDEETVAGPGLPRTNNPAATETAR